MNVLISKNAELFYKALEDIWAAEQTWNGSPNIAVWHCTQAAEKVMKGLLRIFNRDYEYEHKLRTLFEDVESVIKVTDECKAYILHLDTYENRLRYRTSPNDPSPEDAQIAITRTKHIINELTTNPKISQSMDEAREVHIKVLKVNLQKNV